MTSIQKKRRRITQACDFCHSRGVKCRRNTSERAIEDHRECLTCVEFGERCTYSRRPKRRGTKPYVRNKNLENDIGHYAPSNTDNSASWQQTILRNQETIAYLIDIYLDTVHPIFPLFCERELWVGWRDKTFPADISQYTSLIAMCALSGQHTKHGSLFSNDMDLEKLDADAGSYLSEALTLVSSEASDQLDLERIRSYSFLALLGTQTANSSMTHKYLGLYHSMCAKFSLHDEARWGNSLDICEIEIRRRLFWAMYRLEVHSACVMGHMIRLPEAQSNVGYPVGLHHPAFVPGRDGDFEDWFAGWNATTDLYRILEHAIVDFRASRNQHASVLQQIGQSSSLVIQQSLSKVQETLSPQFGQIFDRSSDSGKNRCGFQATKILFTIHLVRMFSLISADAGLNSVCQVAEEMIASTRKIPSEYIRASGLPLLQELAGVGHILGTIAAKNATSQQDAIRLDALLSSIATFLEDTAAPNSVATTMTHRLRAQMEQVKQHIAHDLDTDELQASSCVRVDAQQGVVNGLTQFDHLDIDPTDTSCDLWESFLGNFTWPSL
ncbi:Nn.00g016380.m01.CDS01 [Neocucurbitaria sp. VM-36]